jgi:integrase
MAKDMQKGIKERILKDGTTVYDCIVSYKDKMTGNWKLKTKTAPSIGKAKKLRAEMQHELKDGFTQPNRVTLKVYLDEWLEMMKSTWAESTYELNSDNCRLRICPALGDTPLNLLRTQQIQQFINQQLGSKLSKRTVIMTYLTLKQALKYAVEKKYIPCSPMDSIRKPKDEKPEMKVLTVENVNQLLTEAKKTEYYALFFTYEFTGARRGELLACRWSDIDLKLKQLSINRQLVDHNNVLTFKSPKTKNGCRQIDLTPMNCVILTAHLAEQEKKRQFLKDSQTKKDALVKEEPLVKKEDLVFAHIDGKPYSPHLISHVWQKLMKRCGTAGISLHTGTRHSHATILLKNGVHPKIVQERLGHSSIVMTMDTYSHVINGMGKAAAAGFDEAVINYRDDKAVEKVTV